MNFNQAQKKAERLSPAKVSKALFQEIRKIEQDFVNLNIEQIEDSEDSFGRLLKHKNSKKYRGTYKPATEGFAAVKRPLAPKVAGEPYNFLWTGDFLKGFGMKIANETVEIFSTGTGSGDKKSFFEGYDNLFGLTDESLQRVINENLLPFFITYFRNELT